MSKEKALQELAKVAESKYLATGIIDSRDEEYAAARKTCLDMGATKAEITAIGDAIMNKYYMKNSRYHIPPHMKEILSPIIAV